MSGRNEMGRTLLSGTGIITSILLAFAIDAAWDARSEKLAEADMIESLRDDFVANLASIDDLLREHQWADSTLRAAFEAPQPETDEQAEALVEGFALGMLVGDLIDLRTGTLEMLLNSGRLDLVSDPDLKGLLWSWKSEAEDLSDDNAMLQANARETRAVLGRLGLRGLNPDLRPPWSEQVSRLKSSVEVSVHARTVIVDRLGYQQELMTLRETTELALQRITAIRGH